MLDIDFAIKQVKHIRKNLRNRYKVDSPDTHIHPHIPVIPLTCLGDRMKLVLLIEASSFVEMIDVIQVFSTIE
jgi:hypothetical protein